jgi:hypothetical protein
VSTPHTDGPPETPRQARTPGGPVLSSPEIYAETAAETFAGPPLDLPREPSAAERVPTLGSLPVGARLVLRCRKDWRDAAVAFVEPDRVVLSVNSPTGHSYRVRRPTDAPLFLDGPVPVLGDSTPLSWRAGRVRYDVRW